MPRFAPENPEDGEMYLLVMAHLGYPGHGPESHKMVVVVVVVVVSYCIILLVVNVICTIT